MSDSFCPSCGRTFPSQAAATRHAEFCDGSPEDHVLAARAQLGAQELHASHARERAREEERQAVQEDAAWAVRTAQEALPPASPQALATLAAAILQRLPRA